MGMTDLITGGLGNKIAGGLAQKLGIDESKATWILAIAVPLIAGAIKYNQSKNDDAQAKGFSNALDAHSGDILNNVEDVVQQGPTEEGNKIVQHIFGNNTDYVAQGLSQKSGFSSAQITGVLATLAPIVMGYLGKEKATSNSGASSNPIGDLLGGFLGGGASNAASSGGIGDLLGNILGGGSSNQPQAQPQESAQAGGGLTGMISDFFDKDKDGSAIDDIAGMFLNRK